MSPKSLAWLTQLSYPVDSKLCSDLCIARDCFMILMLRSFQFNALSRGNQRPNLPYKKAWRAIFGGFSCCIRCGPDEERIVDIVPGGTELVTQVKTGSGAGRALSQ